MGNTFDSELKGKLEEAGEVYSNICIHNAESKLRTFEDWKQDRQEFYQHYQDAIEAAISYYYQDGKWWVSQSHHLSFGNINISVLLVPFVILCSLFYGSDNIPRARQECGLKTFAVQV